MNTPKTRSKTRSDSERSSPMQIERTVAEIQVNSIPFYIPIIRED